MEELEKINRKCYEIFSFVYDKHKFRMYESLLFSKEQERVNSLNEEVKNFISANLRKELLYQEDSNLYYIQLYTVCFMENKLNDNQFLKILEILLSEENYPENFLSPLILILMSERKLQEDSIRKIYEKIKIQLQSINYNLGDTPYDYRYHLLKRKETPEDIIGELLTTYDELGLVELHELIQEVMDELNSELRVHKIKNIQQIESIPSLKMEHHYFQVMKQYWNTRNKKEKIV